MLGNFGETLVVDWGLAKIVDHDSGAAAEFDEPVLRTASSGSVAPTLMGTAIGTPAYMPPEQAAGLTDQLGPRSDVYSLGATLFCLLTGNPPFNDTNSTAILER